MATTAFTKKPAMIARLSLSCRKVRWSTPTRTAVTPSTRMVAVSSRIMGVASGLPARSAKAGAANQNRAYQPTLNSKAIDAAVATMSSIRPRH